MQECTLALSVPLVFQCRDRRHKHPVRPLIGRVRQPAQHTHRGRMLTLGGVLSYRARERRSLDVSLLTPSMQYMSSPTTAFKYPLGNNAACWNRRICRETWAAYAACHCAPHRCGRIKSRLCRTIFAHPHRRLRSWMDTLVGSCRSCGGGNLVFSQHGFRTFSSIIQFYSESFDFLPLSRVSSKSCSKSPNVTNCHTDATHCNRFAGIILYNQQGGVGNDL